MSSKRKREEVADEEGSESGLRKRPRRDDDDGEEEKKKKDSSFHQEAILYRTGEDNDESDLHLTPEDLTNRIVNHKDEQLLHRALENRRKNKEAMILSNLPSAKAKIFENDYKHQQRETVPRRSRNADAPSGMRPIDDDDDDEEIRIEPFHMRKEIRRGTITKDGDYFVNDEIIQRRRMGKFEDEEDDDEEDDGENRDYEDEEKGEMSWYDEYLEKRESEGWKKKAGDRIIEEVSKPIKRRAEGQPAYIVPEDLSSVMSRISEIIESGETVLRAFSRLDRFIPKKKFGNNRGKASSALEPQLSAEEISTCESLFHLSFAIDPTRVNPGVLRKIKGCLTS